MKSVAKRIKGVVISLMYVGIYYLTSLAVYGAYYLWNLADGRLSSVDIEKSANDGAYALTVISSVLCLWIYLFIGKMRKKPLIESIKVKAVPQMIYGMSVCLAMGCRLLVSVYYSLSQKSELLSDSIEKAALNAPETVGFIQVVIALFSVIAVAPVFEEILFRGIVMTELKKIMRPWAAITLQAIVFGVVHGVLFQSIFAVVMGVALGIVYHRTENIKAAVVCHAVFNMSAILMQDGMSALGMVIYSVAGILLTALSLFYIIDNSKKDK